MPTPASHAKTSSNQSKSERVFNQLRQRIRELDLPPGAPIRKNEIALEYGVSRAPVSEAIARLAAEGLVDVFPQSGSFVAPMRREDIREALFIRTALETAAIRLAAQVADDALMASLEENLQAQERVLKSSRPDLASFDQLDEAFHATIMSAVNSPATEKLLESARVLLDRPRFLALPEKDRPMDTLTEHRRIVDAIGTGDADLAAAAMQVHLRRVTRAIEAKLSQVEASDTD
jgi:DNA-binding GntR family transcriptional regulator